MNSRKIRYSLFVLSFYRNQYNWTQAYLMVLGFYISLYIFVQHLKNEKRSSNGNTSNKINFLRSFVLHVCSLWGGVICFGKAFLPANVYTCAIFLLAVICTAEVSTGQHFLPCPALSCFLPSSWRAAGQDKNQKRVLPYRTGQDRTPGPPVLCSALMSIFCPVLPCPASYLGPGGRQDRTKIKNASCFTGQDTKTVRPVLSSDVQYVVTWHWDNGWKTYVSFHRCLVFHVNIFYLFGIGLGHIKLKRCFLSL